MHELTATSIAAGAPLVAAGGDVPVWPFLIGVLVLVVLGTLALFVVSRLRGDKVTVRTWGTTWRGTGGDADASDLGSSDSPGLGSPD